MSFLCQLNQCVDGNVVKVDEQCACTEKCLSGKARKIKVDLKNSSGKTYQKILEQPYNHFILDGELEWFKKITEEWDMALLEWREAVHQHKDELSNLLEEMARDSVTFLDELELVCTNSGAEWKRSSEQREKDWWSLTSEGCSCHHTIPTGTMVHSFFWAWTRVCAVQEGSYRLITSSTP